MVCDGKLIGLRTLSLCLGGIIVLRIINYLANSRKVYEEGKFIHPFYRDTFSILYGINVEELPVEEGVYPDQNLKMLLPLIKNTVKGYEDKIRFFYDVRTTEEFGYPAPEYLLLHGVGLKYVVPLGVKGMEALAFPFALLLAEHAMKDGDYALVCCAQLNTPFDESEKYEAGVLLLDKTSLVEKLEDTESTMILSYSHSLSEAEFAGYLKEHPVKTVCSEPDDFSIFFVQLSELLAKEEMIFSWNSEGHLGYVHIKKGVVR